MDDAEKIDVVRTLSSMAMAAELAGEELVFFNHLTTFFENLARKHYLRGYAQARKDLEGN